MENNFMIQESQILEIIKKIIYVMPELIEKDKLYTELSVKHTNLSYEISLYERDMKNFYPTEYFLYDGFRNLHTEIYSGQWPNDLERMFYEKQRTEFDLLTLSRELNIAESEYEKLYNSQKEVLNSYGEDVLKAIIIYLDIDIDLDNKDVNYGDLILENIKSDFEVLKDKQIELPFPGIYSGTVTILKAILKKGFAYKKTKEKYNECNIDLEILNKKHQEYSALENKKFDDFIDKEYTVFNRLFRRKKLDKLDSELDELSDMVLELKGQILSLEMDIEKLNLEKNNFYKQYIGCHIIINILIDRLGQRSLKELIQRLKIKITSTDDNYFDEKEEMKKALKKWFEEDIEKLRKEAEINNEEISTSKQKIK